METIADLNKETVDGLRKLVRMNHDASEGYADAADRVDNDSFEQAFKVASDQRSRFANELKTALNLSDEDIPEGGTTLGAFHRSWLNVRSAFNGGDEQVVLTEAARGESALIDAYEDVLTNTAGSPLNATMHEHIAAVRSTRESIGSLKSQLS